jgi:hypothetical protein
MNSTTNNWKKEYKVLGLADLKRRHPVFYADSPDVEKLIRYPKVKTANGLTYAILKFLEWKGHYANRISTQGQANIKKMPRFNIFSGQMQYLEKVEWTHGNTKIGTPDITAIVYGRAVWIEVKAGNDRMSVAQEKQRTNIQNAGGVYYIARDMQEFYTWYYDMFPDPEVYTTGPDYDE